MRARRGVVIALWLAFAFVTWNVIFDRHVAGAAVEFTREQIIRYQQGLATTSIDVGFSPRVRDAAMRASLWTSPIIVAAALSVYFGFRRHD
jgi:hypothetical protein